MTTFSRETELSFHRQAAEQEARLVADLEHILSMLVTNRKHYDEIQERLLGGSGTTGLVADRLQRNAILIELNPQYAEMARNRIEKEAGLFTQVQMTAPASAQAKNLHEPSLLSLMEAAE